jgi:hypothetical protein
VAAAFEAIAVAIADRWTAERDTRLGRDELESARADLEAAGIPARVLPDGSFLLGDPAASVSPGQLFVAAFRRVCGAAGADHRQFTDGSYRRNVAHVSSLTIQPRIARRGGPHRQPTDRRAASARPPRHSGAAFC